MRHWTCDVYLRVPILTEAETIVLLYKFSKQKSINNEILAISDFIWLFLGPYMGVIPNPKMAFIFPISCILALIFPILITIFPNMKEKVAC